MTFAAKLIEEGKYDEAIAEATKLAEKVPADPLPMIDRAGAYELLERFPEAVADYEKAFALDAEAGVLETESVDDGYFNALICAAKAECKTNKASGVKWLDRYKTTVPDGQHHGDVIEWRKRLLG
jgi:tetratricopeptide (TPR) repeat protein